MAQPSVKVGLRRCWKAVVPSTKSCEPSRICWPSLSRAMAASNSVSAAALIACLEGLLWRCAATHVGLNRRVAGDNSAEISKSEQHHDDKQPSRIREL